MTAETPETEPTTHADVLAAIAELDAKVDAALETIAKIAEEASPIIKKMSSSPLVKMLGGKS